MTFILNSYVENLCLNETNLIHYSYDWCKEDEICELNWFLSFNDHDHFEYLLKKFIDETDIKHYIFSISCEVKNEIYLKHIWLTMMKLHRFCT